jgi:hypothetical protein
MESHLEYHEEGDEEQLADDEEVKNDSIAKPSLAREPGFNTNKTKQDLELGCGNTAENSVSKGAMNTFQRL